MSTSIANNIAKLQQRIVEAAEKSGRPVDEITLMAVSKTRPAEDIETAYAAGLHHIGENYLQEAIDKWEALRELPLTWHFIGPIQSNKTRPIAERFDWVHSVDRLKIAQRLNDQRPEDLPPIKLCLQVNISGESSKSGCPLSELEILAKAVANLPRVELRGLMAIPAKADSPNSQREPFRKLAEALTLLKQALPEQPLDTLSMGMSGDLEAAIAEGSTTIRIGTDIFGQRRY